MNLNTEANLQAEFYHACRLIGQELALEVLTPRGRLDILLLSKDRKRGLAIVEVKPKAYYFTGCQNQIERYKKLGLPVHGLSQEKDPHALAKTLKAQYADEYGIILLGLEYCAELTPSKAAKRSERHSYFMEKLARNGDLNIVARKCR